MFVRMAIRILPPDCTKCIYNLGEKFGCHMKLVPRLLRAAKELDINVIGVWSAILFASNPDCHSIIQ